MQITLQRPGVRIIVSRRKISTQALGQGKLGKLGSRNATGLGAHMIRGGRIAWGGNGTLTWGFVTGAIEQTLHLILATLGSCGRDWIREVIRIIP